MNKLILTSLTILTACLSFAQDYQDLFTSSLEETTEVLISLGFSPNKPTEDINNETLSINFESFDGSGQFENKVLTYNSSGELIKYTIITSKTAIYNDYYSLCSHKEAIANSTSTNAIFQDALNRFTLKSQELDGISYYAIEVTTI